MSDYKFVSLSLFLLSLTVSSLNTIISADQQMNTYVIWELAETLATRTKYLAFFSIVYVLSLNSESKFLSSFRVR